MQRKDRIILTKILSEINVALEMLGISFSPRDKYARR